MSCFVVHYTRLNPLFSLVRIAVQALLFGISESRAFGAKLFSLTHVRHRLLRFTDVDLILRLIVTVFLPTVVGKLLSLALKSSVFATMSPIPLLIH
jgi:hypothetical protein